MSKNWTAATVAKNLNAWTKNLYGQEVFDCDVTVAELVADAKDHEMRQAVRQIPGQSRIEADEDGTVSVAVDDGGKEEVEGDGEE